MRTHTHSHTHTHTHARAGGRGGFCLGRPGGGEGCRSPPDSPGHHPPHTLHGSGRLSLSSAEVRAVDSVRCLHQARQGCWGRCDPSWCPDAGRAMPVDCGQPHAASPPRDSTPGHIRRHKQVPHKSWEPSASKYGRTSG